MVDLNGEAPASPPPAVANDAEATSDRENARDSVNAPSKPRDDDHDQGRGERRSRERRRRRHSSDDESREERRKRRRRGSSDEEDDDEEDDRRHRSSRRHRSRRDSHDRDRDRDRDDERYRDRDDDRRRDRDHDDDRDRRHRRRDDNSEDERERRRRDKAAKQAEAEASSSAAPPKPKVDIALTRAGGAYIPPAKLKLMMQDITDKSSEQYQRMNWDRLKKKIHGHVNKVNVDNIVKIVRELLQENIIRGKGLLARSVIQAQAFSPSFSHVYAAFIAIINSKFPNIGELIIRRLVIQFKRAFRTNNKGTCIIVATFLGHLTNQRVLHEILILQMVLLLMEMPTDDSIEIVVSIMKTCGQLLMNIAPQGLFSIFEELRQILEHCDDLQQRTQYTIENLFHIRKDKFSDYPTTVEDLDLIDEEDQTTHLFNLVSEDDKPLDPELQLNVFKFDPDFEANEAQYEEIRKEIIGDADDSEDEEDAEGGGGAAADDEEDDEDKADEPKPLISMKIVDMTEQELVAFRRNVYLTVQSSLDFQEAAHKLIKNLLRPGLESEMCSMIVDCCAQQRTYESFYGKLAERFCRLRKEFQDAFEEIAKNTYHAVHRFDMTKLRNMAKLVAHLLSTDAISWEVLSEVKMTEADTTSFGRIYIKILFTELCESMGLIKLDERLHDNIRLPSCLQPDDDYDAGGSGSLRVGTRAPSLCRIVIDGDPCLLVANDTAMIFRPSRSRTGSVFIDREVVDLQDVEFAQALDGAANQVLVKHTNSMVVYEFQPHPTTDIKTFRKTETCNRLLHVPSVRKILVAMSKKLTDNNATISGNIQPQSPGYTKLTWSRHEYPDPGPGRSTIHLPDFMDGNRGPTEEHALFMVDDQTLDVIDGIYMSECEYIIDIAVDTNDAANHESTTIFLATEKHYPDETIEDVMSRVVCVQASTTGFSGPQKTIGVFNKRIVEIKMIADFKLQVLTDVSCLVYDLSNYDVKEYGTKVQFVTPKFEKNPQFKNMTGCRYLKTRIHTSPQAFLTLDYQNTVNLQYTEGNAAKVYFASRHPHKIIHVEFFADDSTDIFVYDIMGIKTYYTMTKHPKNPDISHFVPVAAFYMGCLGSEHRLGLPFTPSELLSNNEYITRCSYGWTSDGGIVMNAECASQEIFEILLIAQKRLQLLAMSVPQIYKFRDVNVGQRNLDTLSRFIDGDWLLRLLDFDDWEQFYTTVPGVLRQNLVVVMTAFLKHYFPFSQIFRIADS